MMLRSGHVFLYQRDEPVGTTILLGDRRDMLYVLRGHVVCPGTGGWLSESEGEAGDAPDRHVIYISFDEESGSLWSTGRRLSQFSSGGDEQDDGAQVESQASEFQYGVGHLYPRGILEQEGAVSEVRGGDSDGAVDLPRQEGVLENDNSEGPFSYFWCECDEKDL